MADLSTALMGIGAAFQGQAPQFLQQQQQRQAQERAQLLQNEQLAEQRQATMFKDAMMMKANPQMAGSILADRKAQLQRFQQMGVPIDTRHTDEMIALYQSGDMNAFNKYLDNTIRAGQATGVLAAPAAPTAYKPGDVLRMPDGTMQVVETPEGYVDPEKARELIQDTSNYRKEFTALPTVKEFANRRGALGVIESAAQDPSAAGDLALIFAYMRMLDPGSVVRESEFQLAAQAGSLPQVAQAGYNRVISGQRLTKDQREDFISRSQKIYERQEKEFGNVYDNYARRAERIGYNVDDALVDYRFADPMEVNVMVQIPESARTLGVTPEEWEVMTEEERADFN
jgi:hypothetical protein